MTVGPESQCGTCIRYRSPFSRTNGDFSGGPFCAAFPAGIPDEVFDMGMDHRQPITGDHGLQWESNGEPYPERSLATA